MGAWIVRPARHGHTGRSPGRIELHEARAIGIQPRERRVEVIRCEINDCGRSARSRDAQRQEGEREWHANDKRERHGVHSYIYTSDCQRSLASSPPKSQKPMTQNPSANPFFVLVSRSSPSLPGLGWLASSLLLLLQSLEELGVARRVAGRPVVIRHLLRPLLLQAPPQHAA